MKRFFSKIKTFFINLKYLKDFPKNVKNFGWKMAWFIFRTNFYPPKQDNYTDRYVEYFEKEFSDLIEKYKSVEPFSKQANGIPYEESEKIPVWFIWFQGMENCPKAIEISYERIKMFLPNNAEIKVITLDNYKDYLPDFPDYVIEKHKKGKIKLAHLSDVIKIMLVEKWGGVLLDAGTYVFNEIDKEWFEKPFWTKQRSFLIPNDYAKSKFLISHFSAWKDNVFIKFTKDALIKYWQKYDTVIHYIFIHAIMMAGYKNIPAIKALVDSVDKSDGISEWTLFVKRNKPFDQKFYDEMKAKSNMYKLSYRKDWIEEIDGKPTFWKYILDNYKDKTK